MTVRNKDDRASQKTVVSFVAAAVTALLMLLLTMCQGPAPNEAAQLHQTAPTLYDQITGEVIPESQQWLIPVHGPDSALVGYEELTDHEGWLSPEINYNTSTSQMNVYIDYAGTERYGSDSSELYSEPVCASAPCLIQRAPESGYPGQLAFYMRSNLTGGDTVYEPNHPGNSSLFYAAKSSKYFVEPPQALAMRVNVFVGKSHDLAWMRLSLAEHAVGLTRPSFFLTARYQVLLKCLLLLIPLLLFYDYRKNGGFYSQRALITGGLLIAWGTANVLIWDINYIVFCCVLFAFSGAFYVFGNSLFRISYLLGYFILVVFAYKYNGGFNKPFVMQTGLAGLIGIGLFLQKPE